MSDRKRKQTNQDANLNEKSNSLLKTTMERLGLSARAYDSILKVSRTIADPGAKCRCNQRTFVGGHSVQKSGQGKLGILDK